MRARIYKPSKTAMQSGRANTRRWVLEYERESPVKRDPLTGWTGSADTFRQVRLRFDSKEKAIEFAEKHGIRFDVIEPHQSRRRPKSYADNFRPPATS